MLYRSAVHSEDIISNDIEENEMEKVPRSEDVQLDDAHEKIKLLESKLENLESLVALPLYTLHWSIKRAAFLKYVRVDKKN